MVTKASWFLDKFHGDYSVISAMDLSVDIRIFAVVKETGLGEFKLFGCVLHILDAKLGKVQIVGVCGLFGDRTGLDAV